MGMYTAAVMASDTIPITVRSECDWKSLVTYGVRLARTEILNPFVRKITQMLPDKNCAGQLTEHYWE